MNEHVNMMFFQSNLKLIGPKSLSSGEIECLRLIVVPSSCHERGGDWLVSARGYRDSDHCLPLIERRHNERVA